MEDTPRHRWDVTPEQAIEIQRRLRSRVQLSNGFEPAQLRTIAGIDASYRELARAAVVVHSAVAVRETPFPYVPGLLSFREAPAVLDALEKLSVHPDLIMCDGQGIA